MIIPDANILIYAHDESAPLHRRAFDWWQGVLSRGEDIGLPWVVVLAFVRLVTHPQVSRNPLSVDQVRSIVEQWVQCDNVRIIQLSSRALPTFFDLLSDAGMGGNLSTDALIALHAREHSAVIYSTDRDFARFKGIKSINPLI